jgi:hypothetical protein
VHVQIGRSILDLAIVHHRLHSEHRPLWDAWIADAGPAITAVTADGGRSAALAALFKAVRRPIPPRPPVGPRLNNQHHSRPWGLAHPTDPRPNSTWSRSPAAASTHSRPGPPA